MLGKIRAATAANRVYFLGIVFFIVTSFLMAIPMLLFPNMSNSILMLISYLPAILSFGGVSLWFSKKHGKQMIAYVPAKASQYFKVVPLVILGMITILPITSLSMVINEKIWGVDFIHKISNAGIPEANSVGELFLSLACFAVLPAFIEEIMFRGILQRANIPNLGKRAPIYAGIAFGLMHANVVSQWGLIIIGIMIGLILRETGSLKLCIWYHFLNNAIALTMGFVLTKAESWLGEMSSELTQDVSTMVPSEVYTPMVIMLYFVFGIAAFIGMLAIIRSMRRVDQWDSTRAAPVQGNNAKQLEWVAPVVSMDEEQKKKVETVTGEIAVEIQEITPLENELKPFTRVNYVWYGAGIALTLVLAFLSAMAILVS